MPTQMKPTKKNSPAIHRAKNMSNGYASEYAEPHHMNGKKFNAGAIENNPDHPDKQAGRLFLVCQDIGECEYQPYDANTQ